MVVPLIGEVCQISVQPREVDVMKSPEVLFIVNINDSLTLQKFEKPVVDIGYATPHISPQSLNALVVNASSLNGTASSRAPEDVHEHADICIFSSSVCPDPGGDPVSDNGAKKTLQHCAAPVVVWGPEENNKAAEAIYSPMYDDPPSRTKTKYESFIIMDRRNLLSEK